jgi:hypothetical protein
MSQLGLGYPVTWGYLFDGAWGEQLYVLAPFILAPLFTYAYARAVGRSREASLLAGLGFGYAGFIASPIGHSGVLSNGFMWAPLSLYALEKGRGSFARGVVGVGISYGLAVLTGIGQGFVYAALVIGAYGAFQSLTESGTPVRSWRRLRPLATAVTGMGVGAALAAFQVLEALRAHQSSIRSKLSFDVFSEGSATIPEVLSSIVAPLHFPIGDVSAYATPLVLILAFVAVAIAIRRREPHTLFWTAMALLALLLMPGRNTPLYSLVHHVPFVNQFRVPPRHAAEWTLAVAILGARGWDLVAERLATMGGGRGFGRTAAGALLVVLAVALTVRWNLTLPSQLEATLRDYLANKGTLTLVLIGILSTVLTLPLGRWREALVTASIVIACVGEPYVLLSRWWFPHLKERSELFTPAPVTQYLLSQQPNERRTYSYILAFSEQARRPRRADGPNLTGMFGLSDVGGYEPLISARYSKALGGASLFGMGDGWETPPDPGPGGSFSPRSRALDVLNTVYVVRELRSGEDPIPEEWLDVELQDHIVVDVGEPRARRMLARGWSGDEKLGGRSGAWTIGRSSSIKVDLAPGSGPYELRIAAGVYGPAAPLEVTVTINGKRVGSFALDAAFAERALTVEGGVLAEGSNEIVLQYSRTAVPRGVGTSSKDTRKLALFVDLVALVPLR